jgi:hypothetical protein
MAGTAASQARHPANRRGMGDATDAKVPGIRDQIRGLSRLPVHDPSSQLPSTPERGMPEPRERAEK